MNKLWVYGCSFSLYSGNLIAGEDENWADIVSKSFNLHLVNRSIAGSGFMEQQTILFDDLKEIDLKNDYIILECSYLNRIYSPFLLDSCKRFFYNPYSDDLAHKISFFEEYVRLLKMVKPEEETKLINWKCLENSLSLLSKITNNFFWWTVDELKIENDLIKKYNKNNLNFDGIRTYDDWIRKNKKYQTEPDSDIHQNKLGHKKQAELFINQIIEYEKGKTNIAL